MTSYSLDEWFWAMFKPTPTLPKFTFGQLFMWIGTSHQGPLCLYCLAQFNLSNVHKTTLFHFMWIVANNDPKWRLDKWIGAMLVRTLMLLLFNFSCKLGPIIMTRYDFLWARWVISEQCLSRLPLYLVLIFGQICMWISANNDHIRLPRGQVTDSELILNRSWPNCTFGQLSCKLE